MSNAKKKLSPSVVVIGAGPNGLCAAAFLRAAGAQVHVFGRPMDAWKEQMPRGMLLRSTRNSSGIASPGETLSVGQFEKETGIIFDHHPTRDQFVAYGDWYQRKAVPNLDTSWVKQVRRDGKGFQTILEDGRSLQSQAVVVASGITRYPFIPAEFRGLPKSLVSHVSEHESLAGFHGQSVVVIGKGQSALEAAALLHEQGARVEIITRGSKVIFIGSSHRHDLRGRIVAIPPIHRLLYPPTDLAGPPNNWAIADPVIFRGLSKMEQVRLFELIGPIGSGYLQPRLAEVPLTTNVVVESASALDHKVCLELSDGTDREVDHVFLGTGYHPSLEKVSFFQDELKTAIEREGSYPRLSLGYESTSVAGLFFLGSLSVGSQGPVNRFVCGTYPVGQYLTEALTGSRIGYPGTVGQMQVLGRRALFKVFQVLHQVKK
jgi:thioredoxin reductase